jgi:hypothetical protein
MRRGTLALSALLPTLVAAACGNGSGTAPVPSTPKPIASASAPKPVAADKQLCGRVCTIQTRCEGNFEACTQRCLPIVRVLESDVAESMAKCVETNAPQKCVEGTDGLAKRKQLVNKCTVDATKGREDQAKINIELFAKAYCDATSTCGTDTGSFSPATCLGQAKGSILSTQGDSSGGLYGSLRPSKVDDIVGCMKGPCEKREKEAAPDLGRCLDEVLAKAAEVGP